MSALRFGCFWLLIIPLISVEALHNPGLISSERRSSQSGLIAIFGNDNITGFHMNTTWKSNDTKDWGEWSPWSPWTPCSTSCGLGITKQTRQCIRKSSNAKRNVFYKRQRLKRVSDVDTKCRGPADADETRYHVCNKQLCPNNTDFRETQCSSFNEKLFNGQKYTWSAYYHAANPCALNCRAIGYRFYATLKPKVMDGTPCNNGTNDSTPYVCVEGQCKGLVTVSGEFVDDRDMRISRRTADFGVAAAFPVFLLAVAAVSCDGSIGGQKRFDGCGVCGGDNSTCRSISGIFTRPDMPTGYNLITRLPRSACNITIDELKPSANTIALKHTVGPYILNGNWTNSWPGDYVGAGTVFTYRMENGGNSGESIFASGPLTESVDLILVFRYANPGIKYEYKLPLDVLPVEEPNAPPLIRHHLHASAYLGNYMSAGDETYATDGGTELEYEDKKINSDQSHGGTMSEYQGFIGDEAVKPRNKGRKKKFAWKLTGYSECTKTCGGGYQTSTTVCVKEHNQQQQIVADKRCHGLDKPQPQVLRCNVKPCQGRWTITEWSPCSVSCGLGVQTRGITCKPQMNSVATTNNAVESSCPSPAPTNVILSKACQKPPCSSVRSDGRAHWIAGTWSKCSATCGVGIKSRSVGCSSTDETECKHTDKPPHQATCDAGPCAMALSNAAGSWILSDWSQCSETCGTGTQTRKVYCSLGVDRENACDQSAKPEPSRACLSDKDCTGLWFNGPWSQCSDTCGRGNQTRTVVCMSYDQKEWKTVPGSHCPDKEKPSASMSCFTDNCDSTWFTSEWQPCSRSCDLGVQKRDVKCLTDVLKPSLDCDDSSRPPARRSCNLIKCDNGHSAPAIGEESRNERENKPIVISTSTQQPSSVQDDVNMCVDIQHKNCNFVAQARLCSYKYYKISCCNSCRNKT